MHPVNFLLPQLGFNFKTVMTKCSWMHLNRLEIWRLYAGWTFARTFYFPWTKTNADTPSGCNVGLSTVKTLTWSPLHRNKESKKKIKIKNLSENVWRVTRNIYIKRAIQKMSVTLRNALKRHFARFERYCKGIYICAQRETCFVCFFVSVRRGTCFLTFRFGFFFFFVSTPLYSEGACLWLGFYYIFFVVYLWHGNVCFDCQFSLSLYICTRRKFS